VKLDRIEMAKLPGRKDGAFIIRRHDISVRFDRQIARVGTMQALQLRRRTL